MARKRSLRGRSRPISIMSRLGISLQKTNAKVRSLERAGLLGHYSFKKLMRVVSDQSDITYKRSRRRKFILKNRPSNISKARLYMKNLQSFIKSITSTPVGIKKVRDKSEVKIKATLSKITDTEITDLDDFYRLNTDKDVKQNAEKIPPSNVYVLIQEAKEGKYDEEGFSKQLQIAMNSNNDDTRRIATRLYNKFVR